MFYGGGVVWCYLFGGMFEFVVELFVKNVTACIFGGLRLDEFFIIMLCEGLKFGEVL